MVEQDKISIQTEGRSVSLYPCGGGRSASMGVRAKSEPNERKAPNIGLPSESSSRRQQFGRVCRGVVGERDDGLSLFGEQGERGGVAVQEIFITNGADFAVAEKADQSDGAEFFLDQGSVVARFAKEPFAAPIAAAQATAVDDVVANLLFQAVEQDVQVLRSGGGVATLKLNCLAKTRKGTDGQAAAGGVAAEDVADEEIAAVKIFEVFVDDEADE